MFRFMIISQTKLLNEKKQAIIKPSKFFFAFLHHSFSFIKSFRFSYRLTHAFKQYFRKWQKKLIFYLDCASSRSDFNDEINEKEYIEIDNTTYIIRTCIHLI